MKYLSCFLLVILLPTAVFAQVIGIYNGPNLDSPNPCLWIDNIPILATFYVEHLPPYNAGATGSRFRVEFSPGFTGTLVSVTSPYANVTGHPLTGVTVNYDGACISSEVHVLELHVMMYGTSPECSWIRIVSHPLSVDGKVDSYDCAGARSAAYWQGTHIQQVLWANCPDYEGHRAEGVGCRPTDEPLPTASATWGAVKALYR